MGTKGRAEAGDAKAFVPFAKTRYGLSCIIWYYAISLKRKVEYI